jgi:hypothetical protein
VTSAVPVPATSTARKPFIGRTRVNAERAAFVVGAAEGIRRRVGVRAWPMLRRGEADLAARVGRALGAERYDRAYAAGARLSQQEAVATVRRTTWPAGRGGTAGHHRMRCPAET